ncbi:MAG: hypothetical protein KKD18_01355 [Nanoarchaeota archaeon]|nr:hypothetical protein [Nanoarchaeota archaeon]MBU0977041.1 hypothetical protein [Nanoarchaeota archaeon]
MAEKEEIIKEKMEHEGLFDLKAMYVFAHNWYIEPGFGVTEEEYIEKLKGDARDLVIKWKATKDVSDYFKFETKMKYEIENMTDVEVEIDGKRKQMNKGKIKLEIVGALVYDKDGKWESSAYNRFMRDVYNKYIIPSRVEAMKQEVRRRVTTFKDDLKSFLNLTARR